MSSQDRTRREVLSAIGVMTAGGLAGCSALDDGTDSRDDGQAGDPVTESVWVETGTDSDESGEPDRAHVYVVRQPETGPENRQPVVMRADPYAIPTEGEATALPSTNRVDITKGPRPSPPEWPGEAYTNQDAELATPGQKRHTTQQLQSSFTEVFRSSRQGAWPDDMREYYTELFLPEGYVRVDVSPIGTGFSTGCNVVGGPESIASIEAAIDWLNGRRPAYDSREGGEQVQAEWTNGRVGMIGESYLGTLQNGVVSSGIEGLETIVPISSAWSWYHQLRANGAVLFPENTGDRPLSMFAAEWTTRENPTVCDDQIQQMTDQLDREFGEYNEFWARRNYLEDPSAIDASVLLIHGLYDYEMMPSTLSRLPEALREHGVPYKIWAYQGGHTPDPRTDYEQEWRTLLRDWFGYWLKDRQTGVMDRPTAIVERPDGELAGEEDWPSPRSEAVTFNLGVTDGVWGALSTDADLSGTERFVDNSAELPNILAQSEDDQHRLVYRTEPLSERLRVSGEIIPHLTVSVDSRAALLSGAILDYGPDQVQIVDRGWMNLNNRNATKRSDPVEPGEQYRVSFPIESTEYVFEPDHQLGIMIYSSDREFTKRPPSSPEVTLSLEEGYIEVPVVGGRSAFRSAIGDGDTDRSLYEEPYPF